MTTPPKGPSARPVVLIVEDEREQRELLGDFLERRGYRTAQAASAEEALERLDDVRPDLVLMDVRMPGMGGLQGLVQLHARHPALPVVLVTAHAQVKDAVAAMRDGAVDYLEKPIDLDELLLVVCDHVGSPDGTLPAQPDRELPAGFVVASAAMHALVREVALVAATDTTLLITGESGTGKERIAQLAHAWSSRHEGPWIPLNCAAIPESLFESELFGHAKGAFTGATDARAGAFENARGGTLVLDEIGELPLDVQPKLLRVLDDGSYRRVGESQQRTTNARVIACTNRDLEKEVQLGTFREDLFWRLNVFRVHVPPLRERLEELPALCRALSQRAGKPSARISAGALQTLTRYAWPGNVRELSNVLQRAAILSGFDIILEDHLPERLLGRRDIAPPPHATATPVSVEEAERRAIRDALERTEGNRTQAAKLLGISRRTLLYRLKRYGGTP